MASAGVVALAYIWSPFFYRWSFLSLVAVAMIVAFNSSVLVVVALVSWSLDVVVVTLSFFFFFQFLFFWSLVGRASTFSFHYYWKRYWSSYPPWWRLWFIYLIPTLLSMVVSVSLVVVAFSLSFLVFGCGCGCELEGFPGSTEGQRTDEIF